MKARLIRIFLITAVLAGLAVIKVHFRTPELIPLGDSITDGTLNYGSHSLGYRGYLQDELGVWRYLFRGEFKNSGVGLLHQRRHSGVIGDPLGGIQERLAQNLELFKRRYLKEHPVILIHAGTNDMRTEVKTDEEIDRAVKVLSDMLTTIHAFDPKIDVYVALLIPSAGQPCERNISRFNPRLAAMVRAKGYANLHYVDMNAAFKNDTFGLCRKEWPKYCMSDSLHPSQAGYRVMAKQWAACIKDPAAVNCNGR
jgi:lysophospholipase L1-like esterase